MTDLVGQTLGQYHIIHHIGEGGMGAVYKAYQPSLNRHVALKVLLPKLVENPDFRERFQREAEAIAGLYHPNILPVYDFSVPRDLPPEPPDPAAPISSSSHSQAADQGHYGYIVMRYIEGGRTLKRVMGNPLTLPQIAHLINQIAGALETAHRNGIIHRDVKPANVLMDGDWALLSDFGLAKWQNSASDLTGPGIGIGTPAYMSPEQGQGRLVDHRTDIYALGVILFQMVTGQIPHHADTPLSIIVKRATEPPPLPRQFNPQIPEMVEQIILKALARQPDERFHSALALAEALKNAVKNLPAELEDQSTVLSFDPVSPAYGPIMPKPAAFQPLSPSGSTLPIPPPPEPTRPSLPSGFVGREAELAAYAHQLNTTHLAVITGLAGVGKTSLALHLAYQMAQPNKIFWYTFHADEGIDAIIWSLATFLAHHQRMELWHMLQSAQLTKGQPPPLNLLLDYVLQAVRGQGFILCLDDLHFLQDDPGLLSLVNQLYSLTQSGEVAMIITSRRVLALAPGVTFEALAGLSQADTQQLLSHHGLSFTPDLAAELLRRTEGNTQLLMLAINLLKRAGQPERLLTRLATIDDIERYLVKEVDNHLSEDDREIMVAVAILLGYPGSRQAIEAIAERRRIKPHLRYLADTYLLTLDNVLEESYREHAILQDFYYDLPGKHERQELHRRAAEYYETDEPDVLRAARHYERAGAYEQAATLATSDVWAVVNQGQAQPLCYLLERFEAKQLKPELWILVKLALGDIYTWLGQGQMAQSAFQEGLAQLANLPNLPQASLLKARACQGMGVSLRYESSTEALMWLRQGLEVLNGANRLQEAALHIEIGLVQYNMGDFIASLQSLEQGLALLPEKPDRLRATALLNIGNVYAVQGNLQQSSHYTRQALEMSEFLYDYFRMTAIWHNMGIDYEFAGEWTEAAANYQKALDQANRLGNINVQVGVTLSLGMLAMKQGHDELAADYLAACLSLARQHHLNLYVVSANSALADLHLRRAEPEAALPLLETAKQMALEGSMDDTLPEIYRELAQTHLARAESDLALTYVRQSLELAQKLEMKIEAGMSWRVLGQIRLSLKQPEPAQAAFEQSLALLTESDNIYEAARTQEVWGHYLSLGPEVEQGKSLLQAARTTFQKLEARRELIEINQWLPSNPET